jgi:phosphoserine phosphatase
MAEQSTILVNVHGPDQPGIVAAIMRVLGATGAEVYDVEQIVVRGRITLIVLVGVDGEKATIRDLLLFGWEQRLQIEFEVVDPIPSPVKSMTVVTVIGERIGPDDFGAVASAIAGGGGNIERIFRLSRYPVVSYELAVSDGDIHKIREQLIAAAAERPIDIAIQPEGLERRAKRMVIMDVDSTLIENEVINLLAEEAGVGPQVAEITLAAMRGEIDFEASLLERVGLLAGLREEDLLRVAKRITVTPGARTFIRTLKPEGFEERTEHEYAETGGLLVGRDEVLAGHASEVHPYFVVLEQAAEQVVGTHLRVAPKLTAFAALIHQRIGGAER